MAKLPQRLRLPWKSADEFITAVHSKQRVEGLTHDLYKYPARFSPEFARSAISAFTQVGDTIVDPFVGGGTTLVESRANGRLAVGSDISTLATFVSQTKTIVLSSTDINYLTSWFENLPSKINLSNPSKTTALASKEYTRNLNCSETWAIRKAIEQSLSAVKKIRDKNRQNIARCIVLRVSQWALDGRRQIPTVEQYRDRFSFVAPKLLNGAREFSDAARRSDDAYRAGKRRTICINSRAEHLRTFFERNNRDAPRLIVTSPPYPGVHMLYHRWQIKGGRETPAPFWIADKLDGAGESYYLMHARNENLSTYLNGIEAAFSGMVKLSDKNTKIVQLVAFSNPEDQLPQYLDVMERCGLREHIMSDYVDTCDGRLWRDVPGRKWHAANKGKIGSSKEVVLIHKPY